MTDAKTHTYLKKVYGAETAEQLESLYDSWAGDYDSNLASLGYRHPAVLAGMVGRHIAPGDGTILDAAAGTGLIGAALYPLGYTDLIAIDLSPAMLEEAARKGVYAECRKMMLGETLDFPDNRMRAVVAAGVFTPGHAPPDCFDELCRITRAGGHIIGTISQPAFEEGGFGAKIEQLAAAGRIRMHDQSSDYISMPASPEYKSAMARVYVLEVRR